MIGVSLTKLGKWHAYSDLPKKYGEKRKHLGLYLTEEEAVKVVDEYESDYIKKRCL